jgi:hypothetical protein
MPDAGQFEVVALFRRATLHHSVRRKLTGGDFIKKHSKPVVIRC